MNTLDRIAIIVIALSLTSLILNEKPILAGFLMGIGIGFFLWSDFVERVKKSE